MIRDTQALLDYEIKKKSAIAALFQQLPTMTEVEVAELKIPKWIREAFLKLKKQQRDKDIISSTLQAMQIIDGFVPDPLGEMRQWMNQDTYIRIDRGGEFELRFGKHIWLPDSGGIWYETIFSNFIDPKISQYSTSISKVRKTVYTETYRNIVNNSNKFFQK